MSYISEINITTDCYNMNKMNDIVHAICNPRGGDNAFCPMTSQEEQGKPVCLTDQITWYPEDEMPEDLAEFLEALEENNIGWDMTVNGEAEGDIRHYSTTFATRVVA